MKGQFKIKFSISDVLAAMKNCIFLVLAVLVAQPIIYMIISQAFYGKIYYYFESEVFITDPHFGLWMAPVLKVISLILLILLIIYVICYIKVKSTSFSQIESFAKKSIKQYPELLFLGLTFLWITFAFFFSNDLMEAFWDLAWYKRGYVYFLGYAVIFISVLILDTKYKRLLLELFMFVATIVALFAAFADGFKWFKLACYRFEGAAMFFNRNYYGYYVAMSTTLAAGLLYKEKNKYKAVYYGLSFVINEFGLLLSLTRGALLGACAGIIVLLLFVSIQEKKFSRKALIVLGVAIATYALLELTGLTEFTERAIFMVNKAADATDEMDTLGSGRIRIWKEVLENIKSSPIVGVGIGNTINPHNEFLQAAAWSGIPAALLYISGLVAMVVKAFKYRAKMAKKQVAALSAVGAYVVSSFFGNSIIQTVPFYLIMVALCFDFETQEEAQDAVEKECKDGIDLDEETSMELQSENSIQNQL